jgi:hypothetical protein
MYATGEGPVPNATDARGFPTTFLSRVQQLPPLVEAGLWPAQIVAIRSLEQSLAANKPRALIQMATGSGKTFTAISFIYRLIKFAGARRVLFLVDRGNLGRQAKKEFDQYVSPYNNFKFGESPPAGPCISPAADSGQCGLFASPRGRHTHDRWPMLQKRRQSLHN